MRKQALALSDLEGEAMTELGREEGVADQTLPLLLRSIREIE